MRPRGVILPAVPSFLIVDDHQEMRLLLRNILRKVSDDIVECRDGSEALPAYVAHRPDCVLMDVEMPGLDGLRATRAILAQFPDARIVIVTQHTDAGTRDAAKAAGATGFVGKDNLAELLTIDVNRPSERRT